MLRAGGGLSSDSFSGHKRFPLSNPFVKLLFSKRTWLRIGLVAGALCLGAVLGCLDFVDYSPYFRQPYYAQTVSRLQSVGRTNFVVTGPLRAGFGRVCLTPKLGAPVDNPASGEFRFVPLAGYGNRNGKPATGVHDDIYVTAIVLKVQEKVGVFVGADALIIPREVAEAAAKQARERFGLTREQIYFGATHTHASLGGWGEGIVAESFAGRFNPGVREWFAAQLVAGIGVALADLTPASLGQGSVLASESVRNRLVGDLGSVDPQFSFMVVKQETGRSAVLGSYAAHATVLSSRNMEFSGDYPGYWQRAIQEATGGLGLFMAGGVGSHSPKPPGSGFEGASEMGANLAALVLRELPNIPLTNVVSFGIRGLAVSLPQIHARLTDQVRLRPWVAGKLLPVGDQTFLQAFRLNDALWVSTPCDFSGELALDLKASACGRHLRCTVTSFNGDYIGYVIPDRYYHLSGYEPRLMSFFGPTIPDYFSDLIRQLNDSLWK